MRRKRNLGLKIAIVDIPELIHGPFRLDFYELFRLLRQERYYFIDVYVNNYISQGILQVLINAAGEVRICASDCDPFIIEGLRRKMELMEIKEVCLIGGDNGFHGVLETARMKGIRTRVILPPGNESKLLCQVVDQVDYLERLIKIEFAQKDTSAIKQAQ